MGDTGTDVAKNAADMILTDDNFVTIIEAVKEGRHIYDNIKKSVHFSISTNVGEIVTMFMGLVLGFDTPLLAIQLLWINFVTDSLPSIALGLEPMEEGIMNKKPKKVNESIFAGGLWGKIVIEGIMIGTITLFTFALGNKLYGLRTGRTMAFFALSALELMHSFNIKSEESIFKTGIFNNSKLILATAVSAGLMLIVLFVPALRNIFSIPVLPAMNILETVILVFIPIVVVEIFKLLKINTTKEE